MMTTDDYVAAGYFLSRYVGPQDCTGLALRRVTLASDHSPRQFFPGTWALSWCGTSREERLERMAQFGIGAEAHNRLVAWADASFDDAFGPWEVFFGLDHARSAARLWLEGAQDVELWGLGLPERFLRQTCAATPLPASEPGYAPVGSSGVQTMLFDRPGPLAPGGAVLGHELLADDWGGSFNSPESLHVDELAVLQAAGVTPNQYGLIERLDQALSCCSSLLQQVPDLHGRPCAWLPWLIVRYSI